MELTIIDTKKPLLISEKVFREPYNKELIHQVVTSYLSGSRQGTRAQKSKSEVKGSNKKPWRQKGTGRARSGSVKSPIWRSGGVTFASKTRNFSQKVNKKMYRKALKSILSELIRNNRFFIIDNITINFPKTRLLLEILNKMSLNNSLILLERIDRNLFLASRNLRTIHIKNIEKIDPVSLISFDKVVMTCPALKKIEGMLI